MAPPHSPTISNIPNYTGPLALGYMFGCGLFGILIVQVSVYVTHFPQDNRWIKTLVWVILVLEVAFTFMTAIAAWNNFGKNWGDVDSLTLIDWALNPLPIINGLVASMVQIFFAWRIYRLSNKIWISIPIVLVSLLQLFAAIYYDAKLMEGADLVVVLFSLTEWIDTWLISSAVCDILISTAMITILARASMQSHFRHSSTLINQIIKFTIETGFVTAIGAVAEVILWRTMTRNGFHYIFFLTLGRLYSNVLLASLNSRAILSPRHGGHIDISTSQTRSVLWSDVNSTAAGSRTAKSIASTINVQTTKVVHRDTELDDMAKFSPALITSTSEVAH